MNLILKTKYTLSTEFVLAQVRGNNHWRTSQVRLEILNDRTLHIVYIFVFHSNNRATNRYIFTYRLDSSVVPNFSNLRVNDIP